jgi:protein-S-isoprenylcysteine O-methyltransferase Ste14
MALNSAAFITFAFSFGKRQSPRDWRSFGALCAFIVALFSEMYGFPLTIYLLSGWLQVRYPGIDLMSHDSGHLWFTLFGLGGDPHFGPLHLVSDGLIVAGFFLLGIAWPVLHAAQAAHRLATSGPYRYVRHPQYVGFIVIMFGFLLQWPTILTLLMFPLLTVMYVRLARHEEAEARWAFGEAYGAYAAVTPAWFPSSGRYLADQPAGKPHADATVRLSPCRTAYTRPPQGRSCGADRGRMWRCSWRLTTLCDGRDMLPSISIK